MRSQFSALALLGFSVLLSACSPVGFSASTADATTANAAAGGADPTVASSPAPTATPTATCHGQVSAISRLTKILFVVDTSGSNVENSYNQTNGQTYLVPATDPHKQFRGGAIEDFVTRYRAKKNFNWGFVTFSDDSARAFVNDGNPADPLFASASAMSNAISLFANERDGGSTPYRAALNMAARAITYDPDLHSSAQPQYLVILLTDGFPSDYQNGNPAAVQTSMKADIDRLRKIAPDLVKLSSIYYGTVTDPSAVSLLQYIAQQGAGEFANVTDPTDSPFQIDDVIPNSSAECTASLR